jgi:hypothetical protein
MASFNLVFDGKSFTVPKKSLFEFRTPPGVVSSDDLRGPEFGSA